MKWSKPTEASEQRAVIAWARIAEHQTPELSLLIHIPNEGKRSPRTGAGLKSLGLSPGFPDLALFVARGPFHGLLIEMKTLTGKVSEAQELWIEALQNQGYRAMVCRGAEAAIDAILRYLRQEDGHERQTKGAVSIPSDARG